MQNTASVELYNLLVTRDFDPEILDSSGKSVTDPSEAEMFSFDWKTDSHNYGTVVILMGQDNNLQVYFGDNLGRGMEEEDKNQWYEFLNQMKRFATSNMLTFDPQNINRLKYTMQGMAAIKEGLFEGYYGTRKISYSDQPKKTRLMIRHNRDLGEGEARYRAIESLFVETADGERFKVPSRSLTHGRMLARHISEGGTPYDAFGQHITEMVAEMNTLARFIRATRNKDFDPQAGGMIETAIRHYHDIKSKAKRMMGQRGYRLERESFDPASVTDTEKTVNEIRELFLEQTLDHRIEEALPVLARLSQPKMKETNEFECWTDSVMEGTWALPNTPESQKRLQDLMSQELTVGPDAVNATEQLYDLIGDDQLFDIFNDIAMIDPDANIWDDSRVMQRLAQLGIDKPGSQTPDELQKDSMQEALVGTPMGVGSGSLQPSSSDRSARFEPVEINDQPPREGDIHELRSVNRDLLPDSEHLQPPREEYSDTLYYRDPITGGIFSFYYAFRQPRIRGTGGMPESRVAEIVQTLESQPTHEDLDTDGVMMTKPSNMSSESQDRSDFNRLVELAKG